jgi:hypothetical protein
VIVGQPELAQLARCPFEDTLGKRRASASAMSFASVRCCAAGSNLIDPNLKPIAFAAI